MRTLLSLATFSNLKGSILRDANFARVKLGGADLTAADVTGTALSEADLSGTTLRNIVGLDTAKGFDRAEKFDKAIR